MAWTMHLCPCDRWKNVETAMQWMIQDSAIPLGCVDDNGARLAQTLTAAGKPFIAIGMIPFTHEVTGLHDADPAAPTLVYGSTQTAAKIADWTTFRPGVFWKDSWWDPRTWVGKRSDFLNETMRTITVQELRQTWVDELTFVKSVGVKYLTGMVLEPVKEDHDNWLIEQSVLDGTDELVMSPVVKLEAEWRFFVVDGEVVTGSMYRKEGIRRRNLPVESQVWEAAARATKEWMPSPNIVIDLALLSSGEYKVVEFNCLNSSGFYNSDVSKLVDALEASYEVD